MEIYTHKFSPGMEMTLDKIKALGVTLPTNGKIEDLIKLNFEEKKQKIKDSVHSWSKRSLTLFGKVTIYCKHIYLEHLAPQMQSFVKP
jgi:hypothetical protein